MERAEKVSEVARLADTIRSSQIALCADYRGLSVAQMTDLRRNLRESSSNGEVVKNTLARLAVRGSLGGEESAPDEVDRFLGTFVGPSLLVYSTADPVSPTKVIAELAKENEKFGLKGAFLDGKFLDEEAIKSLSKMPGREELLAKLLQLLNAPATNLVRFIDTPATQVVRVLDAQRQKLAEGGA